MVYVGTGSDGIRSNVIIGRGLYYSDDAGATWERRGLVDMGQLGAVEIHPDNPDVAYVAALGNPWAKSNDRGVYRTRDAGQTWEQVLFTSDSVGAIDLEGEQLGLSVNPKLGIDRLQYLAEIDVLDLEGDFAVFEIRDVEQRVHEIAEMTHRVALHREHLLRFFIVNRLHQRCVEQHERLQLVANVIARR